jgi:hypothetical protein
MEILDFVGAHASVRMYRSGKRIFSYITYKERTYRTYEPNFESICKIVDKPFAYQGAGIRSGFRVYDEIDVLSVLANEIDHLEQKIESKRRIIAIANEDPPADLLLVRKRKHIEIHMYPEEYSIHDKIIVDGVAHSVQYKWDEDTVVWQGQYNEWHKWTPKAKLIEQCTTENNIIPILEYIKKSEEKMNFLKDVMYEETG